MKRTILIVGLLILAITLSGCIQLGQSESGPTYVASEKSQQETTKDGLFGIPTGTTQETRTDYTSYGLGAQPNLQVSITNCNPSVNILAGLGEVTDIYVSISNFGTGDAHNVQVTASASDEDRPYKNSQVIGTVSAGQTGSAKLTLDTQANVPSLVTVKVTSSEGAGAQIQRNC